MESCCQYVSVASRYVNLPDTSARVNDLGDLLSHRGRGLSHCPSGEHRVSLSPVAMVYPGTHRNVVRDPGVSPPDMTIRLEFSGTRICPHRISVNNTDMQMRLHTKNYAHQMALESVIFLAREKGRIVRTMICNRKSARM